MRCVICNEFFNPGILSEVFDHEHKGISVDREYFGTEVTTDCIHPVKQCNMCPMTDCPEREI